MFVGLNLELQWVPWGGKVVWGDTKVSPGRVSLGVTEGCLVNNFQSLLDLGRSPKIYRQTKELNFSIVFFKAYLTLPGPGFQKLAQTGGADSAPPPS